MHEIPPTPEPSEWGAHRRDHARKRASETLPAWADWILAIAVGGMGGWVGEALGGLIGGIVGAVSGLALVRLFLFTAHWIKAPAVIWAADQKTIATLTAERDQLQGNLAQRAAAVASLESQRTTLNETIERQAEEVEHLRLQVRLGLFPSLSISTKELIAFRPEQPIDAPWLRDHFLILPSVAITNQEHFPVQLRPSLRLEEASNAHTDLRASSWPVKAWEAMNGESNLTSDLTLQPGETRRGYLSFPLGWNTTFVGPWLERKILPGATVLTKLVFTTGSGKEGGASRNFHMKAEDFLPQVPEEWVKFQERLERGSSLVIDFVHDESNDVSMSEIISDEKRTPNLT